jgi:serine/threonine protein kinase
VAEEFGPYLLHEMLGVGGMGEVYRAYDTRRDRTVALKRLRRELASDETFQARFRRESRMAARLNEPHIIPIHDFGEIDGHLYLDMRLVDGTDLGSLLDTEGALPPALSVDIVSQIASALQAAHASGLVHRDVKPSNLLLTGMSDDRSNVFAYLVDFGIARGELGPGGTALTSTTDTVGTVAYMAPERISGGAGDHRSDIYALACVFYECLTGKPPFPGESFQVMFAHVNTAPPAPSSVRPGVPPPFDAVVRRGMAKDPADRYQTANEFAAAARAALAASRVLGPAPVGPGAMAPSPPPARLAPPPPPPGTARYGQYTPPPLPLPPHPSRPIPLPANLTPPPRPSSGSDRRTLIAIAIATVIALAVGIGIVVAVRSGGGTPAARSSTVPSPTGSTPPAWRLNYLRFSNLIGSAPGDTASAYKHASCELKVGAQVTGMVDQVACKNAPGSTIEFNVGRFSSADAVRSYLDKLESSQNYGKRYWTLDNQRRGLLYTSPSSADDADLTSSICAMPTYLVEFYGSSKSGLTTSQVFDLWKGARFPDTTPTACS